MKYVFKPRYVEDPLKEVAGRSLPRRATRPEATTPEDIVKRTELHQRYVEPTKMVLGQSKHGLLGKSGVHQFFP